MCLNFFFSSRRRHTRLQGDWSSDVCSSDLAGGQVRLAVEADRLGGDDDAEALLVRRRVADLAEAGAGQLADEDRQRRAAGREIGRASCRERVEASVAVARVQEEMGADRV